MSANTYEVGTMDVGDEVRSKEASREAVALQTAIFNSVNFSSIATDANGVIQIFNVGAERMLGYSAAEVMNQITPADISDPQELPPAVGMPARFFHPQPRWADVAG